MKRRVNTPWGPVVVDDSIKRIPRYLQYLQGDVWQGYAGFMHLTDMSTPHLKNLLSFLRERERAVVADARTGALYQLLHTPYDPTYDESDRAYDDLFIESFEDVPLVRAITQLIAKRERVPTVEERAMQRHIDWLETEIATLTESRDRAVTRLARLRGAGL